MPDMIVGIDLGTTNSEVAVVRDGQPRVLTVDGDPILPSVVGLAEDGRLLVGKPARNQWVLAPDRTVKSIKRKMGQDVKVPLGDQTFRPQEISAMILRRLKDAGGAANSVSRSARRSSPSRRTSTTPSGRPPARPGSWPGWRSSASSTSRPPPPSPTTPTQTGTERFLVYDLGGGTFDVSIVQAEGGVFEVLSSHGDTQLGGDDFDELLAERTSPTSSTRLYGVDLRDEPRQPGAAPPGRRGGQAAALRPPVRPDRGGVHRREGRRPVAPETEIERRRVRGPDPPADRPDDGLRAAWPWTTPA